jgi:hypothetical protein
MNGLINEVYSRDRSHGERHMAARDRVGALDMSAAVLHFWGYGGSSGARCPSQSEGGKFK